MDKVTAKKAEIIQQVMHHFVQHGLSDIGLRRLAAVTGTSDRMLIYYFKTKDALIGEVLHTVAANLAQQLDSALGQQRRKPEVLLQELLTLSHTPEFNLVTRLWFEVIGLAARAEEPYASNATAIANNWVEWIASRLEDSHSHQAAALFAELEGRLMLSILGLTPS